MDLLISIIIPCYNSGMFLQKTLDMLKHEDLENCEVILIDDGSKDNTLEIIKSNSSQNDNIRYVTRENRGVSVSRNEGIYLAKGKYIYFLDSDDEITSGTITYFKETIKNLKDYDLIAFGYKMVQGDVETLYVNSNMDGKSLLDEKCADLFFRGLLYINICSSLINRDFLIEHQLFFKEGIKIGEDYDFLRMVTLRCQKAYYDGRLSFVYKLREGSATNGNNKPYDVDSFRSLLLSVQSANQAEDILNEKTINYYLAARYSAHLKSYLKSRYKSEEINRFFCSNHYWLYRRMNKGRKKVMMAIWFFRLLPVNLILNIKKETNEP